MMEQEPDQRRHIRLDPINIEVEPREIAINPISCKTEFAYRTIDHREFISHPPSVSLLPTEASEDHFATIGDYTQGDSSLHASQLSKRISSGL